MSVLINFDKFAPTMGPISWPANAVLFRGCDRIYPQVSERPAYFTHSFETAEVYGSVCMVKPVRSLTLYDLRFLKGILKCLIESSDTCVSLIDPIATLSLAFGLSSMANQLQLIQKRYAQIIKQGEMRIELQAVSEYVKSNTCLLEVPGCRIAETVNDHEMCMLLKQIFYPLRIDGYIAPRLFSPFHTEKTDHMMIAEIVLFEPVNQIKVVLQKNKPDKLSQVEMDSVLQSDGQCCEVGLAAIIGKEVMLPKKLGSSGGMPQHAQHAKRKHLRHSIFDPLYTERLSPEEYAESKQWAATQAKLMSKVRLPDYSLTNTGTNPHRISFQVNAWPKM